MWKTPRTPAATASELTPLFVPTLVESLTMKNHVVFVSLACALAATPAAWASEDSSCHFHGKKPAAEAVVIGCAQQQKNALVKAGKLDPSWQAVKLDKAELVDGKKGKEWKVMYKNPAVSDAAKQTLYIFFSVPGNYIAANHTGL
jgi:hypothetical protein